MLSEIYIVIFSKNLKQKIFNGILKNTVNFEILLCKNQLEANKRSKPQARRQYL